MAVVHGGRLAEFHPLTKIPLSGTPYTKIYLTFRYVAVASGCNAHWKKRRLSTDSQQQVYIIREKVYLLFMGVCLSRSYSHGVTEAFASSLVRFIRRKVSITFRVVLCVDAHRSSGDATL